MPSPLWQTLFQDQKAQYLSDLAAWVKAEEQIWADARRSTLTSGQNSTLTSGESVPRPPPEIMTDSVFIEKEKREQDGYRGT